MLTLDQMKARQRFIGSSEVAALMGIDPWKSASDVWLEKTGKLDLEKRQEPDYIAAGNVLEDPIINWAIPQIPVKGPTGKQVFVEPKKGDGHLAATLDCAIFGVGPKSEGSSALGVVDITMILTNIEAKKSVKLDEWGDIELEEIPDHYYIQQQAQMKVIGPHCRMNYSAVLLPGFRNFDFRIYPIERNDSIADKCADVANEFWDRYIIPDVPPPNFAPSPAIAKMIRKSEGTVRRIADQTVITWREAVDRKREAEKLLKAARAKLDGEMLDATIGECEIGHVISKLCKRRGYTVKDTEYRKVDFKATDSPHVAGLSRPADDDE